MDEYRLRLIGSLALYGAAISMAALYISLAAYPATQYPFEAQRPTLIYFLFPAIAAILCGAVLAGGFAHFLAESPGEAHHPLLWVCIGLLYGTLLPFLTGMFLPFSFVLRDLVAGEITAGSFWTRIANAAFYMPSSSFFWGTFGLYAAILGGLLLGVGAWLIDVVNAVRNPRISKYCTYALTLVLSLGVAISPVLAPLSLLASLGWR